MKTVLCLLLAVTSGCAAVCPTIKVAAETCDVWVTLADGKTEVIPCKAVQGLGEARRVAREAAKP